MSHQHFCLTSQPKESSCFPQEQFPRTSLEELPQAYPHRPRFQQQACSYSPFQLLTIILLPIYILQQMNVKSQLVELQISDKNGKPSTYYTYDGYYQEKDRQKVRQYRRTVEKRTFSLAAITGLACYSISKKFQMASIRYKTAYVPTKGLLSGAFGFGFSYLMFDLIGTYQLSDAEKECALNSRHLPLWKNKNLAVNPDRAFFQLVDNQNNELSIFHSGLTPEAAARVVPDKIIGDFPEKPSKLS